MQFIVLKKGGIVKFLAVGVFLLCGMLAVGFTDSAKVFGGHTSRAMPICSVDTGTEKVAALSFDLSFGDEYTAALREILNKDNTKATFFVTGAWAQKYPDSLAAFAQNERFEIGAHSVTHPHLTELSQKQVELELTASKETISSMTSRAVSLFRCPYGEYSDMVLDTAASAGLTTVQYDVNAGDTENLSSLELTNRVIKNVKNGSIILMLLDTQNTLAALPAVLEGLKNKGYRLETVGEMLLKSNYVINEVGKQIRR